jgi:hypothetical protein
MTDAINHPQHYNAHPAGIECIDVIEHFGFNIGNAIKYLWREGLKGASDEDLKKAAWYVAREVEKRAKDRERAKSAAMAAHRAEGGRKAAVTRKRKAAKAARTKARKAKR